MKKSISLIVTILLVSSLALMGCGKQSSNASGEQKNKNEAQTKITYPLTINPEIPSDQEILSKGPNGETGVPAATLKLTEEDVKKIKEGKFKAAIAMHFAGNDFSTAIINGVKDTFEKMGIEVVAVTDAQFKPEKQIADIETIMASAIFTKENSIELLNIELPNWNRIYHSCSEIYSQ